MITSKKKLALLKSYQEEYDNEVHIVTKEDLIHMHNNSQSVLDVFKTLDNDKLDYICFLGFALKSGTYQGMCTNGIRYGKATSFISLPKIEEIHTSITCDTTGVDFMDQPVMRHGL